ncbi:hypothetical protein OSSY52_09180 [Tepiditoga spiralis]|uniref:Bacterial Ig-like domain-containing protein n=1 Tax=Tepiditoga spiralis TaxID=2108365 RepID=A0A7G1G776_9BACT|nr:Ig-like domain-containing protein [Tepiditoga spiralis]BBE30777.1 hypothetical protein OSSY52_09180 [Tepiditoga spiralis]
MKKIFLFILLFSFLFIFTGCFLDDKEPPKFIQMPELLNPIPEKAGDTLQVKLNVVDDTKITKIEFFKSGETTPFFTKIYDKSTIRDEILSSLMPYGETYYDVLIKVTDSSGNSSYRNLNKKFRTPDKSSPEILNVNLTQNLDKGINDYTLTSNINDIGSGLKQIRVFVDNATYNIQISDTKPTGVENYYYYTEKTGYSYSGLLNLELNSVGYGKHTIKIEAYDNTGKRTVSTREFMISPTSDTDLPVIEVNYPPYVEPGENYQITISASDASYIQKVKLNEMNFPISPSQPIVNKTITLKAPTEPTKKTFTAYAEDLFGKESSTKFDVFIAVNTPPVIKSFSIDTDNPSQDAPVTASFDIVDDIGLSTVRLYVDSTKIAEFGQESFQNNGRTLTKTATWTKASKGKHVMKLEVYDLHNKKSESSINIQTKDNTAPIISEVYIETLVGGNDTKKREIHSQPTFGVAFGDKIRFYANVSDAESDVKEVEFKVDGQNITTVRSTIRPNIFYSDELFDAAPTLASTILSIDVSATNTENIGTTITGNTLIIQDSVQEVYQPKIDSLIVNPILANLYDSVESRAEFADDGKLDEVKLEIKKIKSDGSIVSISDGVKPYTLDYPQGKTATLNVKWTATPAGTYVAIATAKNSLGITSTKNATFTVSGISLDIVNPADGKVFNLDDENTPINYEVKTMIGIQGTVTIIFDSDKDGDFSTNPATMTQIALSNPSLEFLSEYNTTVNKYTGQLLTTNSAVFPEPGRYRFRVDVESTEDKTIHSSSYTDITLRDMKLPVLEYLKIKSDGLTENFPDTQEVSSNGEKFYSGLDFSGNTNNTDIIFNLRVSDDGSINSVELKYDNETVALNKVESLGREDEYQGVLDKTKVKKGSKVINVTIMDSAQPNSNKVDYSFNMVGIELNKPTIESYDMALSGNSTSLTISKDDGATHEVPTGEGFNVTFSNTKLTDDTAVGRFKMILEDQFGNQTLIKQWDAAIDYPEVTEQNANTVFGSDLITSWNVPSDPGNYTILLEVDDKWYVETEGTSLKSYTEKLNRNVNDSNKILERIPITVIDYTPPAIELEVVGENTPDNIEMIKNTFAVSANIQDKYDEIKRETIVVKLQLADGTVKTFTPSTSKEGEKYITAAMTLNSSDIDGPGKLWIEFDTLKTKMHVVSKKIQVIVDQLPPQINEVTVEPRDSGNPSLGTIIVAHVGPDTVKEYDIKEVKMDLYSNGNLVNSFTAQHAGDVYFAETGDLASGDYTVKVKVTDYAGNVVNSTDKTITIEKEAPTLGNNWTHTGRQENKMAYKGADINNFSFTASDNDKLYQIIAGITKKGETDYKYYYQVNPDSKTANILESNLKENGSSYDLNSNLTDGDHVNIFITLVDNSSNGKTYKGYIYKDDTAPQAPILTNPTAAEIISENNVGDEKIVVDVTDNVGVRECQIVSLKDAADTVNIVENEQMQEGTGATDWVYTLSNLQSGLEDIFNLTVQATDLAGNAVNGVLKLKIDTKSPIINDFNIDATVPKSDDVYYVNAANTSKNFNWDITESNLNSVQILSDGIPHTVPASNVGNEAISQLISDIRLSEGTHSMRVKAIDKSSHESDSNTGKLTMVYDLTDPYLAEVKAMRSLTSTESTDIISADEVGKRISLSEDTIALKILFTETNFKYSTSNVVIKFGDDGATADATSDKINYSEVSDGGYKAIEVSSLDLSDGNDKQLDIEITDLAGNKVTKTLYIKK